MKMKTNHTLLLLTLLLLASCHRPVHPVLARYAENDSVRTLLLVQHTTDANALASLYTKSNGSWHLEWTDSAYIGRNGIDKQREGDSKTPTGELHPVSAFGILPNPGCALPYTQAFPSLYACDEDCPYYNQLIDTAVVHHACHGEHIIEYVPAYHYALTTDYNSACCPGLGSNIFVHCKGDKPYTAGCIALDEAHMRQLIQSVDNQTIIYVE